MRARSEQPHARLGVRPRPAQRWFVNEPPARRFPRVDLRELWVYREVVRALATRDLKLRYRQTVFGVGWAILQPAAAMLVFTVLFSKVAGIESDGLPYPVFVYAGLVAWVYVSGSVSAAAESLAGNRALVTKVYFPRLTAPIAAVLPGLLDLVIALAFGAVLIAAYEVTPGPAVLLTPVWIALAVLIACGAGIWLAALNALYRDVRHALGFLLQLWLFASPVVIPTSLIGDSWRALYALNPMVGVIDGLRWSLLDGPAPPAADLLSAASTVLLLVTGTAYFARAEQRIADEV